MPSLIDIERALKKHVMEACQACFSRPIPEKSLVLQPTRKAFKGDYSLVLFPLIAVLQKKPEVLGQLLGAYLLQKADMVSGCEQVGGFLNVMLKDGLWIAVLEKQSSEALQPRKKKCIVMEYSSPNTNKPLHLGHMRNCFLGDAMSNLYTAMGHTVHKLCLVNDRGIHICKSMAAYMREQHKPSPESTHTKGDHLVGDYYVRFEQLLQEEVAARKTQDITAEEAQATAPIMQEAKALLKKWEHQDPATRALWKQMNGWVYAGFEATYRKMGIRFDKMYYESETYLKGKALVDEGLAKGIFYKPADGSVWVDTQDKVLGKKVLRRGDGTSVYITQDLGTAEAKYADYRFDESVHVVGNEQDHYFKTLFLVLKKLGRPYADGLCHLSYGMVDLPSGRMKSREGTVVDADRLIEDMESITAHTTQALGKQETLPAEERPLLYAQLAMGAIKYFLLRVHPKKHMRFDPKASIDISGMTATFIQYTYARSCAVASRAQQEKASSDLPDIHKLPALEADERALLCMCCHFHMCLQEAAEQQDPSVLAHYLYGLAKAYNQYYTTCPMLSAEAVLRSWRLWLSQKTAQIVKQGMALLGIAVPERM